MSRLTKPGLSHPPSIGGLGMCIDQIDAGAILIGNGVDFDLNTLTAGSGLSIVNGAGVITLSATGTYELPMASASVLGGIKVGANLAIDGSGVLSAPYSTNLLRLPPTGSYAMQTDALLKIGDAPFDGVSTGHFRRFGTGNAIAMNFSVSPSASLIHYLNVQHNGVETVNLDSNPELDLTGDFSAVATQANSHLNGIVLFAGIARAQTWINDALTFTGHEFMDSLGFSIMGFSGYNTLSTAYWTPVQDHQFALTHHARVVPGSPNVWSRGFMSIGAPLGASALVMGGPSGSNEITLRVSTDDTTNPIVWINALKINNAGVVTQGVVPYVKVKHNTSQTFAGGSYPLAFNSTLSDSGTSTAQHDNTTNNTRLTCRVAGTYLVGGMVIGQSFAGYDKSDNYDIFIYKNGTTAYADQELTTMDLTNGAATGVAGSVVDIVDMAIGDYVELWLDVNASDVNGFGYNFAMGSYANAPTFWMRRLL